MNEILRNMIYIILTGCGVTIAKYIVDLINKKVDELQSETDLNENYKLMQYVDNAQDVISNVVLSVSQTYVDSLKEKGEFSKEAQDEAKNKAIKMAEKMITDESKNAIIMIYGDFNLYLDSAIEAMVKQNKK